VPGVPDAVTFWHGPDAWLYTCGLGDGKFEITTNTREPASAKEKVSWGQDATIEDNAKHFEVQSLLHYLLKIPTDGLGYRISLPLSSLLLPFLKK